MQIQCIIFPKDKFTLNEARDISQRIIKNKNTTFYKETEQSYRFRNIPKTKFNYETFRTKKLENGIALVFGELK